MDSDILGYGFPKLLRSHRKPVVAVLNELPAWRFTEVRRALVCAVLVADLSIAQLYLCRSSNRRAAVRQAEAQHSRALVIAPAPKVKVRSANDARRVYDLGRDASRRVVEFVHARREEIGSMP